MTNPARILALLDELARQREVIETWNREYGVLEAEVITLRPMVKALQVISKWSSDGRRTASIPVIRRTADEALAALRAPEPEAGGEG